ncbi:MAG: murein biosynthesis integral membrane protein MurJ, partial [Treponema sp.]|nr:murein biosynthesis integral membrane protein MurJ [Treponema sp.]
NRILAPAFYAQSDARSPTVAGIVSFAANVVLAAVLVGPLRGAGIALSLTLAGAVNTVALFALLGRNPRVEAFRAFVAASRYVFKLLLFSALAVIPVLFLSPVLADFFSGGGRLYSRGIPLAINALVFAAFGLAFLALSRDRHLRSLLRRRGR